MILIAICTFILIALAVFESYSLNKNIKKVPLRILVNGTRGKSTVTRLVNAALNNCGYTSMAKSTGSHACMINPDLSETQIDRRFGKNMVREQRLLFKTAVKNNCNAVVCECSAVRPESQIIFSSKLIRPTHVVITNTYNDHIDQMGYNAEEILSLSVPQGLEPITTSALYQESLNDFKFKAHPNSIAIALKVCEILNLDTTKALEGMKKANGDIGMTEEIKFKDKTVINGFAVNDVTSAKQLFNSKDSKKVSVIFANRRDREFRITAFNQMFKELNITSIFCIGDNRLKCQKIFNGKAVKDSEFETIIKQANTTIICCGNINGSGKKFLDFCMENNR